MQQLQIKNKIYHVDSLGFLIDFQEWDEDFAVEFAPTVGITSGLTERHWKVINFIRSTLLDLGKCPLVYQTCKLNNIRLKELKELFPTGYLRGACKLAGLTYREGYLKHYTWLQIGEKEKDELSEKTYEIDVNGFLINPDSWDRKYAINKADELNICDKLTVEHWNVIMYLRTYYKQNDKVPTVYETCEANHIDLEDLEQLFPVGYQRGAVKIAGLRVR